MARIDVRDSSCGQDNRDDERKLQTWIAFHDQLITRTAPRMTMAIKDVQPVLERWASKMLQDCWHTNLRWHIDDAVQEWFVRMYLRELARYDRQLSFSPFGWIVMRSVCMNTGRDKKRHRTVSLGADLSDRREIRRRHDQLHDRRQSAEIDRWDSHEAAKDLIARVKEDDRREILSIRFINGLSCEETAEAQGLSRTRAARVTFDGMTEIRKYLKHRGLWDDYR